MHNAPRRITTLTRDRRTGALSRMLPGRAPVSVASAPGPVSKTSVTVPVAAPKSKPTKFDYTDAEGRYEYHYTHATEEKPGSLRIRTADARMTEFRESRVGRAVEHLVDIHAQGGAWYEVTTKDFSADAERIGKVFLDGLVEWLKTWNKYHVGHITVDTGRFQRVERGSDRLRVVREGDRIVTKHPDASPEQLAALASRFRR